MKIFFHLYDKDKDPSFVNYIIFGFGAPLATALNKIHVSANMVTIFRVILVIIGIYFFSKGEYNYYLAASILIIINIYLDGVDGDLARLSKNESEVGEWMEMLSDGPLAAMQGLVGFSMAWGIYKQTGQVEVWYVLFFIAYGVIMNNIFRSFSFHDTDTLSTMLKGFQQEYDTLMKYSIVKRIYFSIMNMEEFIILFCLLLNNQIQDTFEINSLFLSLIIICSVNQIRWLSRIILQGKYLLRKK